MFTGIIEEVGEIYKVVRVGKGVRVTIKNSLKTKEGDSISVDGVCLTVEEPRGNFITVYLSEETLYRSHFKNTLRESLKVNLERALTPESFLGGHLVMGHVDCTGEIYSIERNLEGGTFIFRVHEPQYMKYLVEKGSVAVNGISLTCFDIKEKTFKVAVIPYTLQRTNLSQKREGDLVNLEFDIIAKYVEKLSKNL